MSPNFLSFLIFLLSFISLVLLGILLFSNHSKSKRIAKLAEIAQKLAKGDLSEKLNVHFSDEFRVLSEAMNQMATALKLRISELEGEKSKVSVILKNMAEGVIAINASKYILSINPAAESMFDVRQGHYLHRPLLEMVRNQEIDQMVDDVILKQSFSFKEIDLYHPSRKVLRVTAGSVPRNEGEISAVLVVSDITEIRKLEHLRQEFVANVSHELRTPLTSIKGFIETLLCGALKDSERAQSFLKMMEEDTERLNRLIGSLLELSSLESKETVLKLTPTDLGSEINKLKNHFASQLKEKNITFVNHFDEIELPEVLAAPDQLKQVLINLIDNAIKFNRENGQIILSADRKKDHLVISIEDTGIGIPEESVARIFERFFRVDKARSRELGGTGLGLSITKHIIEAHGGTIWCESKPGKGSKFSFTLQTVKNEKN